MRTVIQSPSEGNYKPMKACTLPEGFLNTVAHQEGWLVSPKYDGIRGVVGLDSSGKRCVLSSTGKVIPNRQLNYLVETEDSDALVVGTEFEILIMDTSDEVRRKHVERFAALPLFRGSFPHVGWDLPGILSFNEIQSWAMSQDRDLIDGLEWTLVVFGRYGQMSLPPRDAHDWVFSGEDSEPGHKRPLGVVYMPQFELKSLAGKGIELTKAFDQFEGFMLREEGVPYHYGRASKTKGRLFKYKHQNIVDCAITGWVPLVSMEGTRFDRLGALKVRCLEAPFEGVEFEVGTGFTDQQRAELAESAQHGLLLGSYFVEVTYLDTPQLKKPRHPVFLKLRPIKERTP